MTTKRISLHEEAERAIEEAVAVLQNGGVILYPTDTVYGLGADALSDSAVDTIYEIKRTEPFRNLLSVGSDIESIKEFVIVDQRAELLAEAFLPGPLSLILRKHPRARTGVGRNTSTLGIRIPDNNFALALAEKFGGLVTSTSANIHGKETLRSIDEILTQLGDNAKLIDLIIDSGRLRPSPASTIVSLATGETKILRQGPIAAEDVMAVLE